MDPAYLPTDFEGRVAWLLEECGEVVQAIGKAGRFGLRSRDPRTGLSNAEQLSDEITDLLRAIEQLEPELFEHVQAAKTERGA